MVVGSPGVSPTIGAAPAAAWLAGLDKPPDGRFGSALVHIPEKSGLPSGNRGVGAAMFTLPSAFRGTPAVGYPIHWAAKEVETSSAPSMTNAVVTDTPTR
jgi:hypothetical protein